MPIIWDIAAGRAEEPTKEDGSSPLTTLTTIGDIGVFVAAACELEDGVWQHDMGMVGETIAVSEVTRLIEEVGGKKLKVERVTYEQLQQRTEAIKGCGMGKDEVLTKLLGQLVMLMAEEKEGLMIMKPVINSLCPQVQPTSVREYLLRCYQA